MFRAAGLAATIWVTGAAIASAQSFGVGVGVEFGGPFYGPPPVYYYGAAPPLLYEQPPAVYVPAPPPLVHASLSPAAIFDVLEQRGYGEFGPMAFRDGVYKLSAVNRDGDVVALEVSALDGAVIRELFLSAGSSAATVVTPAPIAPQPRRAPASGADPLVVY